RGRDPGRRQGPRNLPGSGRRTPSLRRHGRGACRDGGAPMLNFMLSEVALWARGHMSGADVAVAGVATDSRAMRAGQLFVALAGERHDGHDHVAAAAEAGAAAALVARKVDVDLPQVLVADTLTALGDLASAVRARRHARVVGITGSNESGRAACRGGG